MQICLCVIYNHNYETNIEKIERLYAGKFDSIYHCMPFFSGGGKKYENVISIYESSHNFEGYISQAFYKYYKENYDYYIFIADDLILNPVITQNNIIKILGCDENTSYIKQLELLTMKKKLFHIPFTEFFLYKGKVIHWSTAPDDLNDHGWYIKETEGCLQDTRFLKVSQFIMSKEEAVKFCLSKGIAEKEIRDSKTDYPRFLSFSDLVVVPKKFIKEFSNLCGVYAAANLHVEVAIPTALFYASNRVKTENEIEWFGKQNHKEDERIVDWESLEKSFEPKHIFTHPIKLSKIN